MPLSNEQKIVIQNKLKTVLREKFNHYQPETSYMPFHVSLLGRDRMALFSFIHSLNTNFGTTIFEPIALELGGFRFLEGTSQYKPGKHISSKALEVIQDIMNLLINGTSRPNKIEEIERIRCVCQEGDIIEIKPTKVDLMLKSADGSLFFIDIKSPKPNFGEFKGFKRTLLEWVAVTLFTDPTVNIQTLIGMTYNPYEPSPYNRWTMAGMLDLDQELKVAKEFWDFVGGNGAYEDILSCFELVGIEMRQEIDAYFANFNR